MIGTDSTPNVRAVTRALAVLESFSGKRLQSLAEVTQATQLDKGTARRLLLTLMSSGFVIHDPATQKYGLGLTIRKLAGSVADNIDVRSIAVPFLTKLAMETQNTIFLSIYSNGSTVCLERLHDIKGMEVRWWAVGGTMPFNCGAAPKLLLSHQSEEEINRVLAQEPVAMTPCSITDIEQLRARLALIRERGWEIAIDDVALGLTAISVPVRDYGQGVFYAISMAGLTPQMIDNERPVQLERLFKVAEAVQSKLAPQPRKLR